MGRPVDHGFTLFSVFACFSGARFAVEEACRCTEPERVGGKPWCNAIRATFLAAYYLAESWGWKGLCCAARY
jgi:hypothetical protein